MRSGLERQDSSQTDLLEKNEFTDGPNTEARGDCCPTPLHQRQQRQPKHDRPDEKTHDRKSHHSPQAYPCYR